MPRLCRSKNFERSVLLITQLYHGLGGLMGITCPFFEGFGASMFLTIIAHDDEDHMCPTSDTYCGYD